MNITELKRFDRVVIKYGSEIQVAEVRYIDHNNGKVEVKPQLGDKLTIYPNNVIKKLA